MSSLEIAKSVVGSLADASQKYSQRPGEVLARVDVAKVLAALREFQECVRYLNTRRTSKTLLSLDSEAAVQDALYLMLRPWILDLVPENPTDRVGAARYSISDFVSKAGRFMLEAKYVRDNAHARSLSKELHDDIETYRHHPACDDLVFFVYDPEGHLPDQGALRRQIETTRVYGGRPLKCHLVVRP